MGAFFVPPGLQQSAAFLTLDAPEAAGHSLSIIIGDQVRPVSHARPYRIVRLEEQVESVLAGIQDASELAAEIQLLGERLDSVVERRRRQVRSCPEEAPYLEAFEQAAEAVDRMAGWFDSGDDIGLRTALADLEAAEESISRMAEAE